MTISNDIKFREEGRLHPPYEGKTNCRNDECKATLNEEIGAYLHKNRETGNDVIFCEDCSLKAQIYDSLRYPLVLIEVLKIY